MDEATDCSARQAAVIYLKNVINRFYVYSTFLFGFAFLPLLQQTSLTAYVLKRNLVSSKVFFLQKLGS